jgi:hypothetical protein
MPNARETMRRDAASVGLELLEVPEFFMTEAITSAPRRSVQLCRRDRSKRLPVARLSLPAPWRCGGR